MRLLKRIISGIPQQCRQNRNLIDIDIATTHIMEGILIQPLYRQIPQLVDTQGRLNIVR